MTKRRREAYRRPVYQTVLSRAHEDRRFIQVLAGPRQVGKTTLARQAMDAVGVPAHFASADDPTLRGPEWLEAQWEIGRGRARSGGRAGGFLVLDEIQKVPDWSELVKRLWDEDGAAGLPLRVMLLGSAPLLVQRGLTESLAGRFELIRVSHWSYGEMRDAFGWSLDQYLFFGGYPGAAALIGDEERWAAYILDSLVETTLSRDILLLNRVDKPGLLRQLVRLGFERSGDVLSYNRMLGMLRGAGNTVTLAHYLDLLSGAGMLTGLPKYTADAARRRGSSPRLLVLNTALIGASSGLRFAEAQADPALGERLARSAVGAQLVNAADGAYRVCYWREANSEVDFVLEPAGRGGGRPLAIEVRTAGRRPRQGLAAFDQAHRGARKLIVGPGGFALGEFLAGDPRELLAAA